MPAVKKAKRGRKPGIKIGYYKTKSLSQMRKEIKELRARVTKLEKVLN